MVRAVALVFGVSFLVGPAIAGVLLSVLDPIRPSTRPEDPHRPVRPQPRGADRRAPCAGHTPQSGRKAAGAG